MRLGNGRWENMQFNSRLQPTQIGLGTSAANQSLLKLDYDYGTTDNNGNIKSQTITVPTVGNNQGFTAVQTYTYDSLNRIKDAKEMISTTQTWKQTFTYDRYGNRRFDQANTTFPTSFANPNITNPTIDTANNRFTTGQGYTYDLSGNLLTDAEGKSFFYDAENKQKEAKNASNQTVGTYFYGGDGKRVKKTANLTGEITIFVYDAGGKMVAEYSTVAPTTPQTSYLTNDHLGSPRIITNEIGQVTSRRDFMPFGEETYSAQRTANLGYAADNVKQGFTGYLKDDETGLDFAEARMYAKSLGRFTSPDIIAGKIQNPQSLNRYSYVWNNPLILTDPTGMEVSWEDSKKKKKKEETEERTDAQREYEDNLKKMVESNDEKTRKRGLRLQATYQKLKDSKIVFHVVKVGGDNSSGELSYKGQEGHLYVDLKGDNAKLGALTTIQKLAHEFKHGEQFLDRELGFFGAGKNWTAFTNDIYDESEAMIAGFEADPISGFQKSTQNKNQAFMNNIDGAMPNGQEAMIKVMLKPGSPYTEYSKTKIQPPKVVNSSIYAVPTKSNE